MFSHRRLLPALARLLGRAVLGAGVLLVEATAFAASAQASSCPPQAAPPTRELMRKAQQQATDRGFLWRISRDGRDSYLYGTLHAGRPEWLALGPRTEAALLRAGVLALEIDVTDPAAMAVLRRAAQGPSRPLPAELMRSLRAAWTAECLPLAQLDQGAVEVHAAQLAVAQAQRLGLFSLYGSESVLLMRHLGAGRPVAGLESAQTQLSALLARDDAEAAAMVRDTLAELQHPQAARTLERLSRDWARGDLKDLEDYGHWCDCLNSASEREAHARLVDGRNPGLAEAIERLHADGGVFAAVGSLHLIGPGGLPVLLQSKGFRLVRVF